MSTVTDRARAAINTNAIAVGLVLAALILELRVFFKSLRVAAQPRGITYTEGVNAILASRPELWFHPVEVAPHFPTIYPLGYHALTWLIHQATGLSVFIIMHGIGIGSAIGGAVAVALLVRQSADGWHGPAAAGALYLFSPAVSGATVLGRVDHLGVMLGLYALLAARQRRLDAAVLLTVASMYVKHSLVVFPATIAIWLLWDHDWRESAYYTLATGGLGLLILGLMAWLSDGQAWLHLIEYNSNHPWLFSVLMGELVWFSYTHAIIIGVLAYAAVRWKSAPMGGLFAVVAVVTALLTVGKVGSWVGYFLPTIAAGAWLIGHMIGEVDIERQHATKAIVILLLVAQFGLYANWASQMDPKYAEENQQRAIEEIEAVGGPILAEDGTLYVKTGVGQVHEPLMMRFVYEYESYGGDNLADEIRDQRFKRIIIGQSAENWEPGDTTRWHEEELLAMQEHYVRVWHNGFYYVYAPKT